MFRRRMIMLKYTTSHKTSIKNILSYTFMIFVLLLILFHLTNTSLNRSQARKCPIFYKLSSLVPLNIDSLPVGKQNYCFYQIFSDDNAQNIAQSVPSIVYDTKQSILDSPLSFICNLTTSNTLSVESTTTQISSDSKKSNSNLSIQLLSTETYLSNNPQIEDSIIPLYHELLLEY